MKDLTLLNPRETEAYLRQKMLEYFGNAVEDSTSINASRGAYHLDFSVNGETYSFDFRKKSLPKILKVLRALR